LHRKNFFRWFRFLLLRGTAESGALKANALRGGERRLAVRAVKGAWFSRLSERSEDPRSEEAGGWAQVLARKGRKVVKATRRRSDFVWGIADTAAKKDHPPSQWSLSFSSFLATIIVTRDNELELRND